MEKSFYLPVTQEMCNYLQRLGSAVDARLEVINRLFTSHKDDTDASVLTSVPFKTYQKEFEDLNAEYSLAKDALSNELRPIVEDKVGKTGISFNWQIEDFNSEQVRIDIV